MCSRGEPLETRGLLWDVQGGVRAARMVGIQQEGESLLDGAVQEGRGTQSASSCHGVTAKGARLRTAALVVCIYKKKEKKSKPRHFG